MPAFLQTIRERIGTSLWFLPSVFVVAAFALAWLALGTRIARYDIETPVWWLHSGGAEDASDFLSSILSSLITMTTLAISITVVVLTLAVGQLGSRLIRSFIADRRTQASLGMLIGSIVYIVLVLRSLRDDMPDDAVPHVAVTGATALVLVSIGILLFFIHHLARSIVSDSVIRRVGQELDEAVEELLPADPEPRSADAAAHEAISQLDGAWTGLKRGGYIQAVETGRLVGWAEEAGAVLELAFRPGRHLLPGGRHVRVLPPSALDGELESVLGRTIMIGEERTAGQDILFLIRHLVEIALRALSPSLNDLYTALTVIDRLGVSLTHIMRRGETVSVWRDEAGAVRLVMPPLAFADILGTAFEEIRRAGGGQAGVLVRLMDVLAELGEQAPAGEHRRVLLEHVEAVWREGERSIAEARDLADLRRRHERALAALAG